jgi:hypothetical protein
MKSGRLLIGLGLAISVAAFGLSIPARPDVQASRPMEVTVCGLGHADKGVEERLELFKAMGVTSIQTYIFWNHIETSPGRFDWSEYDADANLFKKHGLKWVPFVIAGPWYVTPEFVRRDPEMVFLRCLEHDRASAIPSIWSPRMRGYVSEYLRRFAEHYLPMDVLESVNLGISGDYGEAIYSVIGNWPGEYHSHAGYWCGDKLAGEDLRKSLSALYEGDIGRLNRAWRSAFASFEVIAPFLPEKAPSERAWQDFLSWYRGAMTSSADFWMAEARRAFPGVEIYLCTGGDMSPEHGSDFSGQAQVAARYGGGVRITNEASSFPQNVRLTRLVDTACRFYGAYFGHEPASAVTAVGMLGRFFNAVTSGARQLFVYNTPELVCQENDKWVWGEGGRTHGLYKDLLRITRPRLDTALFFPYPSSRETPPDRADFGDLAAEIRRLVDYDLVDERLVRSGILAEKSTLVLAGARILSAEALAEVRAWVDKGGVLIVLDSRPADLEGRTTGFEAFIGLTPETDEIGGLSELAFPAPDRLPSISKLPGVFVGRAFKNIAPDATPLLNMRYTEKGRVAWARNIGRGRVYVYFGPMDIKPREESWTVAHKIPLRFVQDALRDAARDGLLKKVPASLNPNIPDVYLVETEEGLWALNMGSTAQKISSGDALFELEPRSIKRFPSLLPPRK